MPWYAPKRRSIYFYFLFHEIFSSRIPYGSVEHSPGLRATVAGHPSTYHNLLYIPILKSLGNLGVLRFPRTVPPYRILNKR